MSFSVETLRSIGLPSYADQVPTWDSETLYCLGLLDNCQLTKERDGNLTLVNQTNSLMLILVMHLVNHLVINDLLKEADLF